MFSKNISRKAIKLLWISFLGGSSILILYIFLVSINFQNMFGEMPSLENLENPKSEEASELYTEDNVLLGKYFRENRTAIEYEKISPNLVNALVATEDSRFEEHSGIDLRGLMRVFFKTFLAGQSTAGGGSTLSQQLAKNLFNTRSAKYQGSLSNIPGLKTLIVKTKEWITAIQLERSYTKKEILTMYLNTVDFGSNAFGVEVAARTFFDRSPDSLNVNEAAMLVGLLKAPTMFNPVENPDFAIGRRNTVLDQMEKYGYLTAEQFDSLKKIPIHLRYNVENHNQGLATYFRSLSTNFLIGWCKERGLDLYSDGLRIYSTIDSRMQKYAEDAVAEHMKDLQKKFFQQWGKKNPWLDEKGKEIPNFIENAAKRTDRYRALKQIYGKDTLAIIKEMKKPVKMSIFTWNNPNKEKDTIMSPYDSIKYYKHFLHTGFLAMDPRSGYIKAWVGGINHKHFKYDHVKQGKRQPGSTFKPIVYATALDLGYTPCYELPDLPVGFPTGDKDNSVWTPQNSDGKFTGEMFTLRRAMANSINSITANLIRKVHPETVVEYAKRLGITSPLDAVPALCLGVCDVSLYEMVGAYGTFANEGVYTEPFFITRIEDKNGNVLQEFIPKTAEAINEETAYMMLYMLRGATEEKGGTALGLNQYGLLWQGGEIGGKTGTTQNYSDGWFIGMVPKLVAGAWAGGDDRCIHFRSMDLGQGARMAMPIWGLFMQKVFKDKSLGIKQEAFAKPSKPLSVELDCKKYKNMNMQGDSSGINILRSIPKEFEQ
jgi:penicillin-binding protein 1A